MKILDSDVWKGILRRWEDEAYDMKYKFCKEEENIKRQCERKLPLLKKLKMDQSQITSYEKEKLKLKQYLQKKFLLLKELKKRMQDREKFLEKERIDVARCERDERGYQAL